MPQAPASESPAQNPSPAPLRRVEKLSGPALALRKLGLVRDIDLALHLPMRYEDETQLQAISSLREGQVAQVQGTVSECRVEERSRKQLVVKLADASGELLLRLLNFYPAQQKTLAVGHLVRVRGEVRGGFLGFEMVHPSFKLVTPETPLPLSLTPIYPSSAQLPQAYLRKVVTSSLARAPLQEILPTEVLPAGLPSLREALLFLHQPRFDVAIETLQDHSHPAWQRLKFDELLAQQLSQAQAHVERAALRAPALAAREGAVRSQLHALLPFVLTAAQQRVVAEIQQDLARAQPMHRLLQGDVGSGKTVVAALAAAAAIDAGWQCALMAPTEILAEQHFRKLVGWLQPLGLTVAWLTGSRKGKARQAMVEQLASGQAMLAVGTHAVIQDDVVFARLGLAIVDEQHRFGVAQRLALRAKLGPQDEHDSALEPHLLMMTATPIPRTLAMSYYADLDVSTIDELPPGRTPIVTKVFADDKGTPSSSACAPSWPVAARCIGSARWSKRVSTWTCKTPPKPTPS